ncbi:MAG TPA: nuclear transport factor 2 family protein [Cyclobacteriaceae bacterium]|jgi:hypothetical protein|nr:nuclear transport factor 2 family protein [Cyclobacteriaceae bacterium]
MKNINLVVVLMLSALATLAQPNVSPEPTNAEPSVLIKEFFDAYRAHNREKVSSMMHPDIMWTQPGNNRLSGVKKSREEVKAMGKLMAELSAKTIELADIKILNATGNSVACLLRWKAVQPTGNVLDVENIDVYTIENGLIVNVKIYSADLVQEDKFWGNK